MPKSYNKSTLMILSDVVTKPTHGCLPKILKNNIEKHQLNFSKFFSMVQEKELEMNFWSKIGNDFYIIVFKSK